MVGVVAHASTIGECMVFRIAQARNKDGEILVTGYFTATDDKEKELIQIMVEELGHIDTYSNKLVSNGKTILFKSVNVILLKGCLEYMCESLELPLSYKVNRNFVGDVKDIEEYLK